jgi:endoglucanase
MRFAAEDLQLIKPMGFDSVKVLVNPEPLIGGDRLDPSKQWYLEEMIHRVADTGLPVVVCLHPEWNFKTRILSSEPDFQRFLGFLETTARFLASRWNPRQLALQVLTEPAGNVRDWNELLPPLWRAARRAMPDHTLILAGDQVGNIDGLIHTQPVADENVLYSFTFYEPLLLTQQGAEWLAPGWWSHLAAVPYPVSPAILDQHLPALLERIPASPPDWRPAVKQSLTDYGAAAWDRSRIEERVRKLAAWNQSHGGRLNIWCAEFGCYQRTIEPAARLRYLRDVRECFERHGIGWAYWSYNETFTTMTPPRVPFGPASSQLPDRLLLDALFAP